PVSRRGCTRRRSGTGTARPLSAAAARPQGRSASAASCGPTRSRAARPGKACWPGAAGRDRPAACGAWGPAGGGGGALLRDVPGPTLTVSELEPVIGPERYARLVTAAAEFRQRLGPRAIWTVSSTAVGGGVAEMLRVLVGYASGLEIPIHWSVIGGDPGV